MKSITNDQIDRITSNATLFNAKFRLQGDVDASGGGEGLAEPIEEAELDESQTPAQAPVAPATEETVAVASAVAAVTAAATPLVNGVSHQNGDYIEQNGKHAAEEEEDENSPVHERKVRFSMIDGKFCKDAN